jgi:hypothetical protein
VSPTVLRLGPYRLFFFSREEQRIHVHVQSADGEAKFWLEPRVELAQNHGLSRQSLRIVRKLIQDHESTIRQAWEAHFGS